MAAITFVAPLSARLARAVAIGVTALLGLGLLAGATASRADAVSYPTAAPMILQNVSWQDLRANRHGICNGAFTHVMKNVSASQTTTSARNYLGEAQKCGLKVIFHFSKTISGGTVYPSRVAGWVNAVKNHPSLAGYLSVKEPSWVGISAYEIRLMYKAFKKADPNHPVYALFGDIPHFGWSRNPYTGGMADVVMVNWYPVETLRSGCSRMGTTYIANGPKWYKKVKAYVASKTPGKPVYVMVQTHKYLKAGCHKKQLPSKTLLWRQVREAFAYAGAKGIAFHTWDNSNYNSDMRRNGTMTGYVKTLSAQVRAGTFQ